MVFWSTYFSTRHTATQSFTKAARWPDRVRKKCDNYKMMLNRAFHFGNFRVNAWIAVWRLEKSKCSHRKPLIIIFFNALCEGVNTVFWELNAYIRVRVRRNHPVKAWVKVMAFLQFCISCFHTICFHSVPIIGHLRLTSPGLFFTTRRVEQNSPGLVAATPASCVAWFPSPEKVVISLPRPSEIPLFIGFPWKIAGRLDTYLYKE